VVYDAQKPLQTAVFVTLRQLPRRRQRSAPGQHLLNVRAAMPSRIELCNTGDVAAGTALKVELEKEGLTLAVFNVDGEFYVLDDMCTHGPGSLSEGFIDGDVVECNFHNGQFNIRTGEVVLPPCIVPMKTYPVTVENGKVVIEV
jgi:nitrite reductase/ring-hydroxylating ferredoxin subunit